MRGPEASLINDGANNLINAFATTTSDAQRTASICSWLRLSCTNVAAYWSPPSSALVLSKTCALLKSNRILICGHNGYRGNGRRRNICVTERSRFYCGKRSLYFLHRRWNSRAFQYLFTHFGVADDNGG